VALYGRGPRRHRFAPPRLRERRSACSVHSVDSDRSDVGLASQESLRRSDVISPSGAQPGSPLRELVRVVFVVDVLVLFLSAVLAWPARSLVPGLPPVTESGWRFAIAMTPALIGLTLVMLAWTGCYTPRRLGNPLAESVGIAKAVFFSFVTVAASSYFTDTNLSRGFLVSFLCVGGALLFAERQVARVWLSRRRMVDDALAHRVLVVGSSPSAHQLAILLKRERTTGYQIVGYAVRDVDALPRDGLPARTLGSASDIASTCLEWGADTVMVTDGAQLDLRDVSWGLERRNIDLIVVPPLADIGRRRLDMCPVAGVPFVHVAGPRSSQATSWPKRAFDLVVASCALLAVLPVMVIAAVAIKLYDGGPVFYRQRRVGLHGQPFDCLKFRSMHVHAEEREAEMRTSAGHTGALFKMHVDPRVTPVGAFMRRFSIDELPQLFNVLGGSMSIVGPRPQQQWEVDTYTEAARRRLQVLPGITGLWQVSGRSDLRWEDAVRLDLYYRDNWSLPGDVAILLKTVRAVLGKRGAY